jgi:hypothetical protein
LAAKGWPAIVGRAQLWRGPPDRRIKGSSIVQYGRIWGIGLLASALTYSAATAGQRPNTPRLVTHESFVEDVIGTTKLPLSDPVAMFAYVLDVLPERVKVYPTENYYYFRFTYNKVPYAGNIRLDAMDRDLGKVHFAFYEDMAEWKDEPAVTYVVLDMAQGVAVEKLDRLVYRISYRDKTVVFALNDLSGVIPPSGVIGPDERYVGPIFDDSAIRFYLIYNSKLKIFHYILDESIEVADQFTPAMATDRILIGRRTGFAFYRDHRLDRKILIGVFEGNAQVNNYYDGPFDQLPDNFIEGDTLRDIILEVDPKLKGKIDRLGGSPSGADRFLISPYMFYRQEDELLAFDRCATSSKIGADLYYACFVVDPGSDSGVLQAERRKPPARNGKRAQH